MDPLSEILTLVNARCFLSGGFFAGGDWAMRFPRPNRLKITAVARGSHWLTIPELDQQVLLETGDVAVFDGNHEFTVSSDPGLDPVDATGLFAGRPLPIVHVGSGDQVASVGGHIDLGEAGGELLRAMPPLIHVRAAADEAGALRWLTEQLLHEVTTRNAGAGFAADQVAQLMLVHVLRAYLAQSESFPAGWLRALADERIAPALRLIHSDPGRDWRLEDLARAVAMSRTTFAERFKDAAGVPPLTYLHNWRMRLAQRTLRQDDTPLSALARSLGYSSDSAFSNAFKRTVGVAPKRYRDAAKKATA